MKDLEPKETTQPGGGGTVSPLPAEATPTPYVPLPPVRECEPIVLPVESPQ